MRAHADAFASRVARHGHRLVAVASLDDVFQRQSDGCEVELPRQWLGDAEDEHVAILRFDFAALENDQPELLGETGIVGFEVELAMFGEHESVDADVPRMDPTGNSCAPWRARRRI